MKQYPYTITDQNGIHARPAGLIVKTARMYQSDITIELKTPSGERKQADAKKLFAVMGLGASKGAEITVTAVGADEDEAVSALADAMKNAGL